LSSAANNLGLEAIASIDRTMAAMKFDADNERRNISGLSGTG
jgi:hypothetical protein